MSLHASHIILGVIAGGPLTEDDYLPPKVVSANYPNALMRPDVNTVHPVLWASTPEFRVGQVLCDTRWLSGEPQSANPRYMACHLVELLDKEFGLEIMSAFEMEYMLFHTETRKPTFLTQDYFVTLTLAKMEDFLLTFAKNIKATGVNIECFHTEHAPGQYEIVLVPAYGVRAADDCFLTKLGLKEMAAKKGFEANFMAKPNPEEAGNGTHFNFSIWHKESKTSAFYDSSKENGLSDTARWFLGGIIHHFRALSALAAPTVNCYRRFHRPWAPDVTDWGIDDRTVAVRVKTGGPNSTYMENRIPSALSNPYIVLASTIAAGIDGLRNKIEPPPPGPKDAARLPDTLADALNALEADESLAAILGKEFVEWFLGNKRAVDLVKLSGSNPAVDDAEALKKESDEYSPFM